MEDLGPVAVAGGADAFSVVCRTAAADVVPQLLAAGAKVVDFSADYRLGTPEVYQQWYGQKHSDRGPPGQGRVRPARTVPRADR